MRLFLAFLLSLTAYGCSETEVGLEAKCGERFCAPSDGSIVSGKEIADFKIYQVEWRGNRFGIYEGDFPTLVHGLSENIGIAVADDATVTIDGDMGIIDARTGLDWPRFIQITGPCEAPTNCLAADFVRHLSPHQ